ncbi:PKD domain-containing protein [Endothiovibrio diazotrophicus]
MKLFHRKACLDILVFVQAVFSVPAIAIEFNSTARLGPQVIAAGVSPSKIDHADSQFDIIAMIRPGVLPISQVSFNSTDSGFMLAMQGAGVLENGDEIYKTTFTFHRGSFGEMTMHNAWGDASGQFNVMAVDEGQQRTHRFPVLTFGNNLAQEALIQPSSSLDYNNTHRMAPQVIMAGLSPSIIDIVDTSFDVIAVVREGIEPLEQVSITQNQTGFANLMQPAGTLDNGDLVYKMTYTFLRGAFPVGTTLPELWGEKPGQFNVEAVDRGQQHTHVFPDIEFGSFPATDNSVPTVTMAANPTQGRAPLSVTLVAAATDSDGTIVAYNWSSSDGQTASGSRATMAFDREGVYLVTLEVVDNDGAHSETTQEITVTPGFNASPTAAFSATPTSGYLPLTVALNGSESTDSDGSIVSYVWSSSDGQESAGVSSNLTFSSAGTYEITLTVTDDQGASHQSTHSIVVDEPSNESPVASFSMAPSAGVAPLTVVLDGSGSTDPDGSIINYVWNTSDGQTARGISSTLTFSSAGNYVVTLTVVDDEGATHQSTQSVSVVAPQNQTPTASFILTPSGGFAPLTVVMDGSGSRDPDGSIVSYAWQSNDGQIASSPSAGMTFSTAGTYEVTLVVVDDDGGTHQSTQSVVVTEPPNEAPSASFVVSQSSGEAPLYVSFDASQSSDPDGVISTYSWRSSDGQVAVGEHAALTFGTSGSYEVTLTVTDNDGATAELARTIVVAESSDASPGSQDGSGNVTLIASHDTSFRGGDDDPNTPRGDQVRLYTGNLPGNVSWELVNFIKFDLSNTPVNVGSAVLRVYPLKSGRDENNGQAEYPTRIAAYRISENWNEATATYNTRPAYDSTIVAEADSSSWPILSTDGTYIDFDITDLYKKWKSGEYGNYGVTLRPLSFTGDGWYHSAFVSSESIDYPEYRPSLILQW